MANQVLGAWDYVILAIVMAASLAIGLYFRFTGGKQKTNEEYLLAEKSMSLIPVGISLMSSFVSSITVLGNSSETYTTGLIQIVMILGYLLTVPTISYLYLPVFYKLNITSTYEYLEMRFGPLIRLLASLTYSVQMLLYNGIVLYAPAIALEAVTGLDRYLSIILVGIVSTVYSTLGGIKAVVWTDSLQTSLMFVSIVMSIVFSAIEVGGINNLFQYAREGGRLDFSTIKIDPTIRHSWWTLMFGGFFTIMSLFGVNHTQVVRFKTLPTLTAARRAVWMSIILISCSTALTGISGISLYSVYRNCDPRTNGSIAATDQILPYFIMEYISYIPGLAGLFVSGLLSASLSTISSACNGLAAVTISDYLGKWIKPSVIWSKIAVFTYSLLFIGLAFITEFLGGIIQAALTLFGAFGGPLLGVFSLGILTSFNNENGAVVGLLSGLCINLWISFGTPRPPTEYLPFSTEGCNISPTMFTEKLFAPARDSSNTEYFYLYRLSYQLYGMIGFFWVFIVGSIVSVIWKKKQPWELNDDPYPNPELFCPPLARKIRRQNLNRLVESISIKGKVTNYEKYVPND